MTRARTTGGEPVEQVSSRNEVGLVGRLSAPAEERQLPSGDVLVSFRIVVDRPPPSRPAKGARGVAVDAIDCTAWTAATRRGALALQPGDVVAVEGALHRRFFRAGAVAQSRYDVEVRELRRLRRAAG